MKVRQDEVLYFFGEDGQALLIGCSINERKHDGVVEQYVRSILTLGLSGGVRGSPWALLSKGNKPPYKMITFRTLSKAFYLAHARAPDNKQVQASLESGIPGAVLLHWLTPEDVIVWLRDWHNSFHAGSKFSFLEALDLISTYEATYQAQLVANVTPKNGRGDHSARQLQWTWIQDHERSQNGDDFASRAADTGDVDHQQGAAPARIPSMKFYESGRSINKFLRRKNVAQTFHEMMGCMVDFRDGRLQNDVIISNLNYFISCLEKDYEG